ncbi:hypothetical protein [Thermococcus eurythermalis]|uniref:hypothetical protein n=1 Tax=Thermococcus eurythermalis TaxID=1505907 RepID=UPI001185B19E|nr:hypothetical protein [Thermococcus eurythermalis]
MEEKKKECPEEVPSDCISLLTKLGGEDCLKLKRILEDIKEKMARKETLLLALQVPLLSAQEEICVLLQLLGNVV